MSESFDASVTSEISSKSGTENSEKTVDTVVPPVSSDKKSVETSSRKQKFYSAKKKDDSDDDQEDREDGEAEDEDDEGSENSHNSSSGKLTKNVTFVSFGYGNGKPRVDRDDVIISVKDMFSVHKSLRDKYDGTSTELQRALLDIEANQTRYESLIEEVTAKLLEVFNSEYDEEISVYIGCEAGRHRSVAVVCMLEKEIPGIVRKMEIIDRANREIGFKIEHRDLNNEGRRQNKKDINQSRSKRRDAKTRFVTGGDW
ncbi:RNase adaptor protein RapZ [Yasminevirus sp. GU-2018]|uniref:RNase adaptor protein RapZ n=1 Tax=Yasminevirus sp. GU-2018 TaxID=2420051 RepID=A0A5K0UAE1_9VIRU|nr:RNase adaptor protein RapZ [Yasminevirus sp. GU-2018]